MRLYKVWVSFEIESEDWVEAEEEVLELLPESTEVLEIVEVPS